MKTVKTQKGTELPLVNLKGKDYLMVAYRLQWLTEEAENYDISTELTQITDEQTVARATVTIFDKNGKVVRRAQATKRETKKDFPDHTEKAETAAIGRALAMIGYGTQMALSDLDEGQRIVDSPVVDVKKTETKKTPTPEPVNTGSVTVTTTEAVNRPIETTKPSSFKKTTETKPAAAKNLDW